MRSPPPHRHLLPQPNRAFPLPPLLQAAYCQGMAFVAGLLLFYAPEEPAFQLFCRLLRLAGRVPHWLCCFILPPTACSSCTPCYVLGSGQPSHPPFLPHAVLPSPAPIPIHSALVRSTSGPNLRRLYLPGLDGLKAELRKLDFLLERFLPRLTAHLSVRTPAHALAPCPPDAHAPLQHARSGVGWGPGVGSVVQGWDVGVRGHCFRSCFMQRSGQQWELCF